jgi:hypothetical protein
MKKPTIIMMATAVYPQLTYRAATAITTGEAPAGTKCMLHALICTTKFTGQDIAVQPITTGGEMIITEGAEVVLAKAAITEVTTGMDGVTITETVKLTDEATKIGTMADMDGVTTTGVKVVTDNRHNKAVGKAVTDKVTITGAVVVMDKAMTTGVRVVTDSHHNKVSRAADKVVTVSHHNQPNRAADKVMATSHQIKTVAVVMRTTHKTDLKVVPVITG